MASSGRRVKLIFQNFDCNPPKSLYLVDPGQIKKVKQLRHKICTYFQLDAKCELYIDGYSLPKWESTDVLREDDVVTVQARSEHGKKEKGRKRKHGSPSPQPSPSTEKEPCQSKDNRAASPPPTGTAATVTAKAKPEHTSPPKKRKKTKTKPKPPSDSDDSDDEASKSEQVSDAVYTTPVTTTVASPVSPATEQMKVVEDSGGQKSKRKRKRKRKNKNDQHIFTPSQTETGINVFNKPEVVKTKEVNTSSNVSTLDYVPSKTRVKQRGQKHVTFDSGDEQADTTVNDTTEGQSPAVTQRHIPQQDTTPNTNQTDTRDVHDVAMDVSADTMDTATGQQNSFAGGKKSEENSTNGRLQALANYGNSNHDYSNQFPPPADYTPDRNKSGPKKQKSQKKNGPFAGVQVYNRQKYKKNAYYPLSKEDQLNTVASNQSVIIKYGQIDNESSAVVDDDTSYSQASNQQYPLEEPIGSSNTLEDNTTVKKDYSQYSPLEGPPRAGDIIAYKVLELSESYTPEMSDYKEGQVTSYNAATKTVTLVLTALPRAKKREGRFELTIEDEDYILTNSTDDQSEEITLSLSALLEPKLVSSS